MIHYFTGTGNSYFIASQLATSLNLSLHALKEGPVEDRDPVVGNRLSRLFWGCTGLCDRRVGRSHVSRDPLSFCCSHKWNEFRCGFSEY